MTGQEQLSAAHAGMTPAAIAAHALKMADALDRLLSQVERLATIMETQSTTLREVAVGFSLPLAAAEILSDLAVSPRDIEEIRAGVRGVRTIFGASA